MSSIGGPIFFSYRYCKVTHAGRVPMVQGMQEVLMYLKAEPMI